MPNDDEATAPGPSAEPFVGFEANVRLASGALAEVAKAAWRAQHAGSVGPILVFDRATGMVVDLDLRGTEADVYARYARPASATKRGRPHLGVVAREVTLLPRHWEWLARQPGGASTTLRRLVDAARKADATAAQERIDVAYRFMAAIAGDLTGFEEVARALFGHDRDLLRLLIQPWPSDIAEELVRLLDGAPYPEGTR